MSDSDFVALGLALPDSLVIVCWLSPTFGSETVPATCRSAVLEDLLLLCLVSEIERFTFCSLWLASLLVTWYTYWYSEALPMRIIPIKTFTAVRLNNNDKTMRVTWSCEAAPALCIIIVSRVSTHGHTPGNSMCGCLPRTLQQKGLARETKNDHMPPYIP